MENEIEIWYNYLDKKIKKNKIKTALKDYVNKILLNKAVIIFELNHLSKLLGIEKDYLVKIIFDSNLFYRIFYIPKRNGGTREINSPSSILLYIQRWIYINILKNIDLHENCVGFRTGYSIRNNAEKHLNKNYILKLDIKDFFPSINIERVIAVFRNIGYSPKISYILAALCTLDNRLPQGSPTSPYLSNIIAKRLDKRLSEFCKKFGLNYTRYADDITISGNRLPKKLIEYIENIISDEGFEINKKKKRLLYKNNQRIITGISVNSNKLTIPKKQKRKIRQIIYYIRQYGVLNHLNKKNINDPIYLERILGYLYFWIFIEPKNIKVTEYISVIKNEIEKQNRSFFELREKTVELFIQ